jgi:exodeoxyribonuclease VII small subunit
MSQMSVVQLLESDNYEDLVSSLTFEGGMTILEQLCNSIESGDVALDKAVLSYERGVKLVEHLKKKLSLAEEKIRVLGSNGETSLL